MTRRQLGAMLLGARLLVGGLLAVGTSLAPTHALAQNSDPIDALLETPVDDVDGQEDAGQPSEGSADAAADQPDWIPAKQQFGLVIAPSTMQARPIGGYAKGCLAGAAMLPISGDAWQAVRLSRGRNFGHPALIRYLKRFANDLQHLDGWPGLVIGDMSQPRGGPMLTGHASHQIGLDADIWFMPMPKRRLSYREREYLEPLPLANPPDTQVIRKNWRPGFVRLIARAVSYPEVERVFLHPAIKRALCEATPEGERAWLAKVRPWFGHNYHFHVRLGCPAGLDSCLGQKPVDLTEDGCGKELQDWLKKVSAKPKPRPAPKPKPPGWKPPPPPKPTTVEDLPADCRQVLIFDNARYLDRAAPVAADIALPSRNPKRRR